MNTRKRTLFLTQFSILLAIEAIFCFTPLGSLPSFGLIVMTLAMIPIIITAIMLGTAAGTIMGAFAGLFSFMVWTFMPPSPVSAFIFTPFYSFGEFQGNFGSLLICFVPRILVGTIAGLLFHKVLLFPRKLDWLRYILSGFIGSLANTLFVMLGIYIFFGGVFESAFSMAVGYYISFTILTSGLPEAALSALAALAVCKPLRKALYKDTGRPDKPKKDKASWQPAP
ncbi:MAG: ECF transporter S component [Ruminococcaceae bacterium]|nr:ECF transporter S component [Oscillospiraceae bacterium]